jgi:hypothetical protein
MEAPLLVIRNGVATAIPRHEADITPSTIAWLEAEQGVGMTPVQRESQQGPLQNGATDLGHRLRPRTLTLVFGLAGRTLAQTYERRDALLALFAPSDAPLQLRWSLPNGATRQLDCHYTGDFDYASRDRMGRHQRTAITLRADDPTFYDPAGASVSFELAASDDAFDIPLAIPWAVGSSIIDQAATVRYPGTWRASPRITIIGPITDPVIRNVTTGEKLDFTGVSLSAGQSYIIDTSYGVATVIDQDGVDRTALLSDDSDLTTFHLASRADVPDGANDLLATGTAATSTTQIFIAYNARYVGL